MKYLLYTLTKQNEEESA